MIRLILSAIFTLAVVSAGPAMYFWDRRPPGVMVYHILWFSTPESLKTQRDQDHAAFLTEQASFRTISAALDRQNAAVWTLATQATAWQAKSQAATRDAASANAWRLADASHIRTLTLPASATDAMRCSAAEAVLRGAAH